MLVLIPYWIGTWCLPSHLHFISIPSLLTRNNHWTYLTSQSVDGKVPSPFRDSSYHTSWVGWCSGLLVSPKCTGHVWSSHSTEIWKVEGPSTSFEDLSINWRNSLHNVWKANTWLKRLLYPLPTTCRLRTIKLPCFSVDDISSQHPITRLLTLHCLNQACCSLHFPTWPCHSLLPGSSLHLGLLENEIQAPWKLWLFSIS